VGCSVKSLPHALLKRSRGLIRRLKRRSTAVYRLFTDRAWAPVDVRCKAARKSVSWPTCASAKVVDGPWIRRAAVVRIAGQGKVLMELSASSWPLRSPLPYFGCWGSSERSRCLKRKSSQHPGLFGYVAVRGGPICHSTSAFGSRRSSSRWPSSGFLPAGGSITCDSGRRLMN
jgi:hypothetical protein